MELDRADRDARVERILDELDDVEARIDELRPADRVQSKVIVLGLLLVLLLAAAALVAALILPGAWDLAPFLIAAFPYALVAWRTISAKNEELAELQLARARLTGPPSA